MIKQKATKLYQKVKGDLRAFGDPEVYVCFPESEGEFDERLDGMNSSEDIARVARGYSIFSKVAKAGSVALAGLGALALTNASQVYSQDNEVMVGVAVGAALSWAYFSNRVGQNAQWHRDLAESKLGQLERLQGAS